MIISHTREIAMEARALGWQIETLTEFDRRNGEVPNGLVIAKRDRPVFEDKPYVVARWAAHDTEHGLAFYSTDYDLDREGAIKVATSRMLARA